MPLARFESDTSSLCSSTSPPFNGCRRCVDAPRNVGLSVRSPPGDLDLSADRFVRLRAPKNANAGSSPDGELPRPPSRASDPSHISEETSDEPSTPLGALDGNIHGLRAHITAPKSSSVNPSHLRSPRRLSVSSSSLRDPERPLCKPSPARDRAPKSLPTNHRSSASESSEKTGSSHRLRREIPKNPLAKPLPESSFGEFLCRSPDRLSAPKSSSTTVRPTSEPIGSSTNCPPMRFLSPTTSLRWGQRPTPGLPRPTVRRLQAFSAS